jgi:hypothetical protein
MSKFFLDTELTPVDHERIADVLLASGYSDSELDVILWQELCPVLGFNLASPAGVWSAFDMKDVEKQVLSGPRRQSDTVARQVALDEWESVRAVMRSKSSA